MKVKKRSLSIGAIHVRCMEKRVTKFISRLIMWVPSCLLAADWKRILQKPFQNVPKGCLVGRAIRRDKFRPRFISSGELKQIPYAD